jgi:hypothetical protein
MVYPRGELRQTVYTFDLDSKEVKAFVLETRPWQQVEFRGVALRPSR